MGDTERQVVAIDRVEGRAIVSLRLSPAAAASAAQWSILAAPLRLNSGTIGSLWLGPTQWLLVSDKVGAETLIDGCRDALGNTLHHAVDQSAAFAVYSLSGSEARDLLSTDCGLDLRPDRFPPGSVARTRLARIAAVIAASADAALEVYIDRSHADYFETWLRGALKIRA